jgi:hypothetical protein
MDGAWICPTGIGNHATNSRPGQPRPARLRKAANFSRRWPATDARGFFTDSHRRITDTLSTNHRRPVQNHRHPDRKPPTTSAPATDRNARATDAGTIPAPPAGPGSPSSSQPGPTGPTSPRIAQTGEFEASRASWTMTSRPGARQNGRMRAQKLEFVPPLSRLVPP